MNAIVSLNFEGWNVRHVIIDGEPWFVASDVATVLGYVNAGKAVRDHCKGGPKQTPLQTAGGTQQVRVIGESDVLRLIVSSKLPAAEQFERWLFEVVLPEIRRTGSFGAQPALPQSYSDALRELAATVEQNEALEAKVTADAPKVAYHERFVGERSDIITVEMFAGQFGSTDPKVRELLHEKGLAVRKVIGERWSKSKNRMEDVCEWRARQGKPTTEWFELLPQHNVPRLHNGQVRQTLYVRQFHAQALAEKLGLVTPELELGEVA